VTDAWLIAIARHHKGTFLTFDARLRTIQSGSNDSGDSGNDIEVLSTPD